MPRLARLLVVTAVLLGPALQAQLAFLVEDIATGPGIPSWPSTEWVTLGDLAVFSARDSVHGIEIWRSDGTAAGTHPILDVCPGICSSDPRALAVVGSTLFFGADDGVHGRSLWKSDGTAAGTTRVREVSPSLAVALGSVLVFTGTTPEGGEEIWRSDGTPAGTFPLGDQWPGADSSYPRRLGYAGSSLLFSASDPVHGRGLWKTDGTVAGTSFVMTLPSLDRFEYGPQVYPSIGSRLFFPAGDDHLWVSDGTPAGTHKATDVPIHSGYGGFDSPVALGDEVFFTGAGEGAWALWKTDGTPAGTVRVKDVIPGEDGHSSPIELTVVGDFIFLRTPSSLESESRLWRSDGTEAGTVPVEPGSVFYLDEYVSTFQALGDKLVFFAYTEANGFEPWVSDGTGAGTVLLADVHPGSDSSINGSPTRFDIGAVAGGKLLFHALMPDGWAVWKSDGTPTGTELVREIDAFMDFGLRHSPRMADLDGTVLFPADDGRTGLELWRSDGTAPRTSMVIDLSPGGPNSSSLPYSPMDFAAFNGSIYFWSYPGGLMRTDGTEAGTESVWNDAKEEIAVAGDWLYFVCIVGLADTLCRTDGTDVEHIWNLFGAVASQLTPAGSSVFFNGSFFAEEELWRIGGVPEYGVMLDIFPGPGSSKPRSITGFGHLAFLSADDGSTGRELWLSDGTPEGTRRVKDIRPGAGSSDPRSIVAADSLVFFVADDGIAGAELWRSDGTAAGTFRVKDIRPGSETSWIRGLTAFGNRVLFAADDGVHGVELWTSDGTEAGTVLVDIRPGAGSSFPGAFQVTGHVVLFAADDGTHGLELWQTNGSGPGTFLIQDVFPGPEPSSPVGFTLSGGYAYFMANDGAHGFELWALDRAELGAALSAAKSVVSPAFPGGTVTFEIVITNIGTSSHPDNPGDEMVDVLPVPLVLTGAFADVGTVSLSLAQNRVAWNGALAPGESATVTIAATVPSSTEFQTFFNQATLSFDADGDGTNESSGVSDDPGRGGSGQATPIVVSHPPLDFHTVTPCRVFDTRSSTPLASGVSRTIPVAGTCGIPATAKAVAANLTVVGPTGAGYVTLYPSGIPVPATANATFAAGQVRSNNLQLGLLGGQADARALVGGNGTVHLALDVTGYYE